MPLTFVPTPKYKKSFKKLYKKYPSLPIDYKKLEDEYLLNPKLGVDLGDGYRKIRLAVQSKNKGKRGGLRIITYEMYLKEQNDTIVLIDIYDKSDKESMKESEYQSILKNFLADH
jgi:mRNA-degrading endonuclease RelE of RelBE toxin-antitoxin system